MAKYQRSIIENLSGVDESAAFQVVVEHRRRPDASWEGDGQLPYVQHNEMDLVRDVEHRTRGHT